ncbi:DUF6497 family protein [Paracoccus sp. MBLB3053]|uniref:DUF6497 family protein n=1 Tax=Paracoccus aurantius TaxID=3073814 RepID=A0ABU2HUZ6_9RHOB|nr:DUF6497 family protein [Paracoccus sp. MBLB3053]MDS9468429.1 DUF6497 family protein [Paracoccus sp. MBLB3053]
MSRTTSICATLAALALPAGVEASDARENLITLPSGAEVRWLETLHDSSGGLGLTYRFRFLMPDLASRVPSTTGSATEPDVEQDRGPIEIDTETSEVEGMEPSYDGEYIDEAAIDIEHLEAATEDTTDAAEEAADEMIEEPALPAAPDVLMQDPVHDDVVWLCENWVLPRIASPAPRPRQIIISIADKDIPFGSYDPDVLQLFEAFRLPADRDQCEWEPW